MPLLISFIRGINVGGHKKIKMADLRDLVSELGFQNPRTLLQSGNVVFEAAADEDLAEIGARIEAGISQRFGFEARALLRTPAALRATLADHPFSAEQLERGNQALVVFLSGALDADALAALRVNNPGREAITAAADALYVFYTDGVARSKLDAKRIESSLGVVASARNWNTCQRLLKLLEEMETVEALEATED